MSTACALDGEKSVFFCTVSGDRSWYSSSLNSQIPSDFKQKLIKAKRSFLTVTWSPLYSATFTDNGARTRIETVRLNKFVDHDNLKYYKYFPNNAGTAASWYKDPGTLFAGIVEESGNVSIILDECKGYKLKYYSGAYEPDNLYSVKISIDNRNRITCAKCYTSLTYSRFCSAFFVLFG